MTKFGMHVKEKLGINEGRGGRRGPENVWGAALAGTICALLSQIWPEQHTMLKLGYVASIATKLSDTFGSEIGKVLGEHCYLITNFQPVCEDKNCVHE